MKNYYSTFYGSQVSTYGLQNGYVDYACLAHSFDHVRCNDILCSTGYENWKLVNGSDVIFFDENGDELDEYTDGCREECKEYFQYFIISEEGYKILSNETNETVWYNSELDLYVWGMTHWGTAWDYVLTDIKLTEKKEG